MNDKFLDLRRIFGSFATGITVVSAEKKSGEAIGMTVNSFSSLSLDPPLALWSLQKNSECYEVFMTAERYGINILHAGQQDISRKFAVQGKHGMDDVAWSHGQHGCPLLDESLAALECSVSQRYEGGDHMILVGTVLDGYLREGDPLVFYGGSYRYLASQVAE